MDRSMPNRPPIRLAATGRALALLALLALTLLPGRPALAQVSSGITSPAPGSAVSGAVPIMGTAVIEPFQRYELYYKLEPSGDDSYVYFDGQTQQVVNGQLGVWQTGDLAPGIYTLRLRVVKTDGNYAEYFVPNVSVNQGPPPTPTSDQPTPTPIPTATFTPVPQPTVAVAQVEQPDLGETPTPEPTPAPIALSESPAQEASTASEQVAGQESSLTRELGQALALERLRAQFFKGVRLSAAAFLLAAALLLGRRLLAWALTQFR